jgi:integrase
MSIWRDKRSPYYQYSFAIRGHRFRGSTQATNRREAEAVEAEAKRKAGIDVKRAASAATSLAIDDIADAYWESVGQHHTNSDNTDRDVARLIEFFGGDTLLSDITGGDLERLITWRRGHRVPTKDGKGPLISNATVNRTTIEVLKKLFTFAKRRERGARLEHEPEWNKFMLNEPEERVRELHDEEADRLDAEMRDDYEPYFSYIATTGVRRNEGIFLRWANVNWATRQIRVKGKGDKDILVAITPAVRDILWPLRGQHDEFVFTYVAQRTLKPQGLVRGQRYPLTESGVKSYWKRLRKQAGLVDFRLHDFRHDVGTKLLRATGNLKLVQRALNHRDIKTTARYAHVLDSEVAEAMQQVAVSRQNRPNNHPSGLSKEPSCGRITGILLAALFLGDKGSWVQIPPPRPRNPTEIKAKSTFPITRAKSQT